MTSLGPPIVTSSPSVTSVPPPPNGMVGPPGGHGPPGPHPHHPHLQHPFHPGGLPGAQHFHHPLGLEPPRPRFLFKMPRVVPNQKEKFETDDLMKRHCREGEVNKAARPKAERSCEFIFRVKII